MSIQYPAPALVSIGNVHANSDQLITPAGVWNLRDVNVTSTDHTMTTSNIPTWAIIVALVFVWFFFLSLLVLLARETRTTGFFAIHINAGGRTYTEHVPIYTYNQRFDIQNRVIYLQSLIGQARSRALPA